MTETIELGSSPAAEPCAQTTDPNYSEKARAECNLYRAQLQRHYAAAHDGQPLPEGCRLVIKANSHDFGCYYEVAVKFDGTSRAAIDAAFWLESNCPETWDSVAVRAGAETVER